MLTLSQLLNRLLDEARRVPPDTLVEVRNGAGDLEYAEVVVLNMPVAGINTIRILTEEPE